MSVFSFTQNPIARAETAIQQRPERSSGVGRVLLYIFYGILTGLVVAAAGLEIFVALSGINLSPLINELAPAGGVLILIVGLIHFRVMFSTLAMTVAAMERERKHNERWEILVLTGIPSHSIVLGKWWAILKTRWQTYAWLALLRAGITIWLAAYTSRTTIAAMSSYYGSSTGVTFDVTMSSPTLISFLLAGLLIAAMTMLNLMFTTACGVYAGIAFKRGALAVAIITRIAMIVGLSIAMFMIFCQLSVLAPLGFTTDSTATITDTYSPEVVVGLALGWGIGTLYDNGMSLASALVSYGLTADNVTPVAVPASISLLTFVVATGFYSLLTIVALFVAQAQAERFGALKPAETKGK